MTSSLFRGSATPLIALLASIFIFDAATSRAVAPDKETSTSTPTASADNDDKKITRPAEIVAAPTEPSAIPSQTFVATAYSLRGRTASGQMVRRGIIAADRRVLPLGTRVRLSAGSQSGEYVVADTGGAIKGRKIDIWVPHTSEAMRFGRRKIQLTVLQYPRGKRAPQAASRPRRVTPQVTQPVTEQVTQQ